jgi:hypothetical protein
MKNGLYSIHLQMLDGVKGRDTGVLILSDGVLLGGQEVTSGFSGSFADDQSEVFGTTLVGNRSLSFRATLKRLADS